MAKPASLPPPPPAALAITPFIDTYLSESFGLQCGSDKAGGIFSYSQLAALPPVEVGPGREHEINADSIGVDAGPFVENIVHVIYWLFLRGRLVSESMLQY